MAESKSTRAPFTARALDALKPRATVFRVWDGTGDPLLKGFGVVVAPSGTQTFILSYTSPETGLRGQITLGIRSQMFGLAQAREAARAARQQIREGLDPKREREKSARAQQQARQEAEATAKSEATVGTVAQLLDLYVRDLEADGKRRTAEFVRQAFARDALPAIGEKKARDVTNDDIDDIIAAVSRRGALVLANRVRTYLIAAWNFGAKVERLPRWRGAVPAFEIGTNPAASTEKALKHEPRGQRWLTKDEVRRVWLALSTPTIAICGQGAQRETRPDPCTEVALKLLFATGQRVEEVLHAEWCEFDPEERLWTIPAARRKNASKNASGEPHLIPLADLHLGLLEALRPVSGGSRWLFPRQDGTGPRDFRSLTQACARLCARHGIARFAPRDIRRTWKTLAGSVGIDLEIRNRIQGHAFDDVGSRHYDRFDYLNEKRQATARYAAALEGWLSAQPAQVLPFVREGRV